VFLAVFFLVTDLAVLAAASMVKGDVSSSPLAIVTIGLSITAANRRVFPRAIDTFIDDANTR
jgi:hypothetical protein